MESWRKLTGKQILKEVDQLIQQAKRNQMIAERCRQLTIDDYLHHKYQREQMQQAGKGKEA